jgi:hypothetical protein
VINCLLSRDRAATQRPNKLLHATALKNAAREQWR